MNPADVALFASAAAVLAAVLLIRASARRLALFALIVAVVAAVPAAQRALRDIPNSDVSFPSGLAILGDADQIPDVGPVPRSSGISDRVRRRVERSVVKVTGRACGELVTGTGWVVSDGLVATNAHVVVGMLDPRVVDISGTSQRAALVGFDPVLDIALLSSSSTGTPLELRDSPQTGTFGVFGHPHGRPLRVAPAGLLVSGSINGQGPDIYGQGSHRRPVMVLATQLEPGDSGAPVVDSEGAVVAMTFAIDPDDDSIGYALEASAVQRVLDTGPGERIPPPPCR